LDRLRRALAVVFGALLLTWPALLNRFPLLYPDSIVYIHDAPIVAAAVLSPHTHPPFESRSEFYTLGLYALDGHHAPWGMLFFQALLVAWTLWLVVRWVIPPRTGSLPPAPGRTIIVFLSVIAILSAASGLSWMVSWLLTDIFGGPAYLCLCLLVLAWETLSRAERWSVAAIACWGIAAHASHILLSAFVCAVLGLLMLLRWPGLRGRIRLLALAAAMPLIAVSSLVAIHTYLYSKPSITSYHPPYLTARVIADGPGRWYLQQHCPQIGWLLCQRIATLPPSSQEILFGPTGIWINPSPEDRRLIRLQEMPLVLAAIRQYPLIQLKAAFSNFWWQMGMFGYDEFGNSPEVQGGLNWALPNAYPDYLRSRQASNRLPYAPARVALLRLLWLSGIVLVCALPFAIQLRTMRSLTLAAVLLPTLLANAFVCGALSQVDERLQLRILWLFPLVAMLLAIEVISALRSRIEHSRAAGNVLLA